MAYSNGRLPSSALRRISVCSNGQLGYLLGTGAAAAFNAMSAESVARYGVTLRTSSARTAYRPYADQLYFWNLYISGRGNLAARPGTSNHGWGLAVDLATPQMRSIVNAIGAKYGWAKGWSDAPSEWWHLRYKAGVWNGKPPKAVLPTLKKGTTHSGYVKKLQRALRAKGFKSVLVTGKYDILTRSAVRRMQKKHKLPVDSIVGPKTWKVIL